MTLIGRRRAFWIACLATTLACLGQAQTPPHQEFVCMHGTEKRVVSVFNDSAVPGKPSAAGCHVDYAKNGETRTVWSSKVGHSYCVAKATALVTNLVEGNYTCKPETIEPPEPAEADPQSP